MGRHTLRQMREGLSFHRRHNHRVLAMAQNEACPEDALTGLSADMGSLNEITQNLQLESTRHFA